MSLASKKEFLYAQPAKKAKQKNVFKQKGKKRPKLNFRLVIFMCLVGYALINNFLQTVDSLIVNQIKNAHIVIPQDFSSIEPATYDVANDEILAKKMVSPVDFNNKLLKSPVVKGEATKLKKRLETLASLYPQIKAGIFVYDYQTEKMAGINESKAFPTASTIKFPILLDSFRRSEKGLLNFKEKMKFTGDFLTGGSGHLQLRGVGGSYPLGYLSTIMMRDSDNSATNMMLYNVGGVQDFNRAMRSWGFAKTNMTEWLPDLDGTNISTPEDMGKMLYNIDNPDFLSLQSTADIVEIMSHVKNTSLIKAGLPEGVQFIHKTGDIGEMLGDIGIVILPSGRRYIVTMMVKRPWNNYGAKSFIVEASRVIYNSIVSNDL